MDSAASLRRAVRVVGIFQAVKGCAVLVAATGALSLAPQTLHDWALKLVEHAHLNPAAKYPRIFVEAATHLHDSHLLLLAAGAAAYATLRFVEAYGLLTGKRWAEMLAAASGAIYIPFELFELVEEATWLRAVLLSTNVVIVILMMLAFRRHQRVNPHV